MSELGWAHPVPLSWLMPSPSDLLALTDQESLSPTDVPQDLHESLLWLLEPPFMGPWSILIFLEINSRFCTGTWNDNHSWHQYHRYTCINKCDTPLELHSREKRQGNLFQSHLLAKSKKKRWQHSPHVSRRPASTTSFHKNWIPISLWLPVCLYCHHNLVSALFWGDASHPILLIFRYS